MSPQVVIVTSWTERILGLVLLVSLVLFGVVIGGIVLVAALLNFVVNVLRFPWF